MDTAVLHVPTIKPLDRDAIIAAARPGRLVAVLENHTVVGGLGEAVAACLAFAGEAREILPIGLPDAFLDAGALPTLHERYGLSTDRVLSWPCRTGSAEHCSRQLQLPPAAESCPTNRRSAASCRSSSSTRARSRGPQVSRVTSAAQNPSSPYALIRSAGPIQPTQAYNAVATNGVKPETTAESW